MLAFVTKSCNVLFRIQEMPGKKKIVLISNICWFTLLHQMSGTREFLFETDNENFNEPDLNENQQVSKMHFLAIQKPNLAHYFSVVTNEH